jgi:hypothetical protein
MGLVRFVLSGLSTMEIVGLAVAFVAVMAFLWLTGLTRPERLVTEPALRSAWLVATLALVRPVTWIPYLLPFVAFRAFLRWIEGERRPLLVNGIAHALTVATLAFALLMIAFVVQEAVTAVLSGLAFITGSGSPSTLGSFRGDWNPVRIAGVAALVVAFRVIVPPLGDDLDLDREPLLWFQNGSRGRFDRIALLGVLAASAVLVMIGAFLSRSG